MLFDSEYFTVRGDSAPRQYLGVAHNDVEVVPYNVRSPSYSVHIVVPSGCFVLFREVLKYSREDLLARPIRFFLTETMNASWVFGFDRGQADAADTVHLWPYRSLPGWAKKAKRA